MIACGFHFLISKTIAFGFHFLLHIAFAGVPGLEPRLTEPESAGLPITPYPKIGSAKNTAPIRALAPLQYEPAMHLYQVTPLIQIVVEKLCCP
jgi:hypothetical protein